MDAIVRSAPLIPPAPKVHARQLGGTFMGELRVMFEMSRSLIGAWCEDDFDSLVTPYTLLGQPGIVISDPAAARRILTSSNYIRPAKASRPLKPLTGEGVLLSEGDTWRRQRKSLAPVFTPTAV